MLVACLPIPAHAWGFEAHRFIMDRAIALLPPEIRPLFERYRSTVVERSIDPDTWRMAGFREESPNHFLNLDRPAHGPYPFARLPREYAAAVAAFGRSEVQRNGLLPWRVEEYFEKLRSAFEAHARRGSSRFDVLFFAAALSHYVSDAHVPFHAVVNFDGQLTGQHGVHARFETHLFERYRHRLDVAPAVIDPIRSPRDHVFGVLLEGTRLAETILEADMNAVGDRDVYDDRYYAMFFARSWTILERRLRESVTAVAAAVAGAWEAAGRPPVRLEAQPPPERRRRE